MAKEIEFKLKSKTTKESNDKDVVETLVFIPSNMELEKKVKITVIKSPVDSIMDDMGLPEEVNDTVMIEFGTTNRQTKLLDNDTSLEINGKPIETQEEMDEEIRTAFKITHEDMADIIYKKDKQQQEKQKTKKNKKKK